MATLERLNQNIMAYAEWKPLFLSMMTPEHRAIMEHHLYVAEYCEGIEWWSQKSFDYLRKQLRITIESNADPLIVGYLNHCCAVYA